MASTKKLSLNAFILMILTSVFGVTNIGIAFHRMGYAAIPFFVLSGFLFFIPFIIMMIEFGSGFKEYNGGMYTWMEKSVGIKFAFVGVFMWYASNVIWMFGKSFSIWLPISYAIFGKDITSMPVMIGGHDFGTFFLGMLGILLILGISALIKNGPEKLSKIASIGGVSVIVLNILLMFGGIMVFAKNNGHLSYPLNLHTLTSSPNPEYQSLIPVLGFIVFTVFAYGGVETMAGVAEDLENPQRDLKRGIFISGILIIICYAIGFLMVGAIMDWSKFPTTSFSSMSALFIIMENLGNELSGPVLGQILVRFSGLSMFFCYLGAMISIGYAAITQLVSGTPDKFWPKSFKERNENGILFHGVKMQAIVVIIFILVYLAFNFISPNSADGLFDLIINMTNVSITLPYIFLIIAWYYYRKNDNLKKDIIIFKSKGSIIFATLATLILVIFGNVFTIIEPFLPDTRDLSTGIWTILGPIIFSAVALYIYHKNDESKNK